jgi:acetyl-CoA decarbonylase/synthase complex subunit gamma
MSFDRLREVLGGRDHWILVLDTKGINVWCAAGKGTFGTAELIERLRKTGLGRIVRHRRLILPQLGAPGVAAHEVERQTGFSVIYGPIRALDLPSFLEAGLSATARMRFKDFPLRERSVLIPVELAAAIRIAVPVSLAFLFAGGISHTGSYWAGVQESGVTSALVLLAAVAGGAVVVPLLLPWLPGRAFSLKALPVAVAVAIAVPLLGNLDLELWTGRFEAAGLILLALALTTYLAMNFTGASTYTSLSGVKREMRWALPFQIGSGALGLLLWIVAHLPL